MTYTKFAISALAIGIASAASAQTREQISIVGSSTVFPYTQAVAERFSNLTGAPSPIVEINRHGWRHADLLRRHW